MTHDGEAALLLPFQRDQKRDFASARGDAALRSQLTLLLGTLADGPRTTGELPWRTQFGCVLEDLRHRPNSPVLHELARVRVRDAIRRFMPGVELARFDVWPRGASLYARVRVRRSAARQEAEVTLDLGGRG